MADPASTAPVIRVQKDGEPERIFEIKNPDFLIGRQSTCDVVLPTRTVSSRHARLRRVGDDFVIEDLGSRNNTYVDDEPIKERGPVRLSDGQVVRICEYSLTFGDTRIWVEEVDAASSIRASVELGSDTSDAAIDAVPPSEALKAVLEVSRAVGSTLEINLVLDRTLEALFELFPQADRGFVYLDSPDRPVGRNLIPRCHRSRRADTSRYTISRTVIDEVLGRGMALCCDDVRAHDRFGDSPSLADAGIRTMICAPILDRDRKPIGMIQLDASDGRTPFEPKDLDLLLAIIGPIAVAIDNARLHDERVVRRQRDRDIENAREVQQALLPEHPPSAPGYAFWHHYQAAKTVGGDYIGYLAPAGVVEGSANRWAITIGDVAGKGMPAALLMAKLSSEVQLALAAETDPARVLDRLNRRIGEAELPDSFITLTLIVLDADRHRFTVTSAGHHSPLIRRADGRVETIPGVPQSAPLGVLDEPAFEPIDVELEPGDVVLLYTDGATDATNPEDDLFGFKRLREAVADAPGRPDELGPFLIERIRHYVQDAPQADDITMVAFGRVQH